MKFKIHYNGEYLDSLIVSGETIEEVKQIAYNECEKRGWKTEDCWSEKISD